MARDQDLKPNPWLQLLQAMCGFTSLHQTHHEHSSMQAPWQQPAPMLARTELLLTMGELYPTDRVYSLQRRSAQYLSFRWMIK